LAELGEEQDGIGFLLLQEWRRAVKSFDALVELHVEIQGRRQDGQADLPECSRLLSVLVKLCEAQERITQQPATVNKREGEAGRYWFLVFKAVVEAYEVIMGPMPECSRLLSDLEKMYQTQERIAYALRIEMLRREGSSWLLKHPPKAPGEKDHKNP
jgi:hypothetical protein